MTTNNLPASPNNRNSLLANVSPDIAAMGSWLQNMGAVTLSTALAAVEMQENARRAEAESLGQPFTPFTSLEKEAVVLGQALQYTQATDYASHLMRYQIIKRARDAGLSTVHPEHFDTIEAFAEAHGMGSSEYYDLISLFEWIFPWLQQNMRDDNGEPLDPADIWMQIGKSKLRQLVPYFRVAIDVPGLSGEEWRPRDDQTLARLEENLAAEELNIDLPAVMANPREYANVQSRIREHVNSWDSDSRPTRLASYLLRIGTQNVRFEDLRRRLRPQAEHQDTVSILIKGNQKYVVLPIAGDRATGLLNKFRDYQIDEIDLDGENAARLVEQVPILSTIRSILNIE